MESIKLRKITNRVGIMLDASVLMVLFNWFSVLCSFRFPLRMASDPVSYTHLRAHETRHDLVCRLLLE